MLIAATSSSPACTDAITRASSASQSSYPFLPLSSSACCQPSSLRPALRCPLQLGRPRLQQVITGIPDRSCGCCNAVPSALALHCLLWGRPARDTYRTGRHVLVMSLAVLKMRGHERSAAGRLVTCSLEFFVVRLSRI